MKRFSAWILASALVLGCFSLCTGFSAESPDAEPTLKPAGEIPPPLTGEQTTIQTSLEKNKWKGKILFYIPNQIMNCLDIFTLNLKLGLVAECNVCMTQAFGFGAGVGPSFVLCKDFNRQYGYTYQHGWNAQFLFMQAENTERNYSGGYVKNYWQYGSNFPTLAERIYAENIRDYWKIGASASCIVGFDVYVHPLEIIDFACGILLLDDVLPQPPFIHNDIPLDLMVF